MVEAALQLQERRLELEVLRGFPTFTLLRGKRGIEKEKVVLGLGTVEMRFWSEKRGVFGGFWERK
jgi:hypothetical protein